MGLLSREHKIFLFIYSSFPLSATHGSCTSGPLLPFLELSFDYFLIVPSSSLKLSISSSNLLTLLITLISKSSPDTSDIWMPIDRFLMCYFSLDFAPFFLCFCFSLNIRHNRGTWNRPFEALDVVFLQED